MAYYRLQCGWLWGGSVGWDGGMTSEPIVFRTSSMVVGGNSESVCHSSRLCCCGLGSALPHPPPSSPITGYGDCDVSGQDSK